jgi:hypothetical protein
MSNEEKKEVLYILKTMNKWELFDYICELLCEIKELKGNKRI